MRRRRLQQFVQIVALIVFLNVVGVRGIVPTFFAALGFIVAVDLSVALHRPSA